MTLRAAIVDDEWPARRQLRELIAEQSWLVLDGEAADGPAAIALLEQRRPDLVFLDVRLPGCDGLEVLARARHRPAVAFTTAHDEYAIRALRLGAVDYLLKPFGRRRFVETATRLRERLDPARLLVRAREGHVPVELGRVERIVAADDYVVLHEGGREHLAALTLAEVAAALDGRFVRVHRSHLVNLDHVAAVRPHDARRFVVVMRDGATIVASRAGTRALRAFVR